MLYFSNVQLFLTLRRRPFVWPYLYNQPRTECPALKASQLALIMPTGEGEVKNYMMTAGLALTIHILLHLAATQTIYLSPLHSLLYLM